MEHKNNKGNNKTDLKYIAVNYMHFYGYNGAIFLGHFGIYFRFSCSLFVKKKTFLSFFCAGTHFADWEHITMVFYFVFRNLILVVVHRCTIGQTKNHCIIILQLMAVTLDIG